MVSDIIHIYVYKFMYKTFLGSNYTLKDRGRLRISQYRDAWSKRAVGKGRLIVGDLMLFKPFFSM